MKVIVAKSAGFCGGVKKTVELAYAARKEAGEEIYTLGPLIHNEEAVEEYRADGIIPSDFEALMAMDKKTVVIRPHGVPKAEEEALRKHGHKICDATCHFVKKIHNYVEDYSQKGYHILILGDEAHPEIKGIVGRIEGEDFTVLSGEEECKKFSLNKTKPICLVAQTTFNTTKFQECVEIIRQKGYDVLALDTICRATHLRQREAGQIAAKVGAMIVIGGRNSSNTRKLFDIAKSKCNKVFFVRTTSDLDTAALSSIDTVGITAGASTPDKIIKEVTKNVRCKF